MGDITAANANLTLTVATLFPLPQKLEGFAADDVYDMDEIETVVTRMGVDGILSGGFKWVPQPQTITLQSDSPSCPIFDQWFAAQKAAQTVYQASMTLVLPAIGLKFVQTAGFLTRYKLPGAKTVIETRRFQIMWQDVAPQLA